MMGLAPQLYGALVNHISPPSLSQFKGRAPFTLVDLPGVIALDAKAPVQDCSASSDVQHCLDEARARDPSAAINAIIANYIAAPSIIWVRGIPGSWAGWGG